MYLVCLGFGDFIIKNQQLPYPYNGDPINTKRS
jgi:hypothetical protein